MRAAQRARHPVGRLLWYTSSNSAELIAWHVVGEKVAAAEVDVEHAERHLDITNGAEKGNFGQEGRGKAVRR